MNNVSVVCLTVLGLFIEQIGLAKAETIIFKQGVSPSLAYEADAATISWCDFNTACAETVQPEVVLKVGPDQNGTRNRILLEFDLTPILEEAGDRIVTIDSIALTLTQEISFDVNVIINLHQLGWYWPYGRLWVGNTDFTDETITWNTKALGKAGGIPGTKLGQLKLDPDPPNQDEIQRTWETTPAFAAAGRRALKRDDHTLRLILVYPAETMRSGQHRRWFSSEDSSSEEDRPELIVSYHFGWPIPFYKFNTSSRQCLETPLDCSGSITHSNRFQDIDCALEGFLCTQLLQAAEILQEPDAPSLDVFLKKPQKKALKELPH